MATHIEDHYEGLQVDLDGQEYIRCKFTNCQLTYRGSSRIRLEQCEIDEHCRLVPLAQAANTIVALTERRCGARFYGGRIGNGSQFRLCAWVSITPGKDGFR
jgi:hypothetical protein